MKSPTEVGSKSQRNQPTSKKAAETTKRLIRHAKHCSLPDTKDILTEMRNKENASKLSLRRAEKNAKRGSAYVSAASSRIQSPQDSMCKEAAKRWKLVGTATSQESCNVSRVVKEARAQKIKEMLNRCKNIKGKIIMKSNRPLNTLVNNMRVMSPCQGQPMKNPKKVLSAMNSPVPDESQSFIKMDTSRITSPHIEYKKMEHKQRRDTKKSSALIRAIRSQPISPENSLYKPQKSVVPVRRLNKIEEARENLIKWITECKFRKCPVDRKKHRDCPKTDQNFYLIGRILGRGAFGKVNLCVHKLSEQLVAIKSLHKDYLKDRDNNEKIQNEINALKTIKHRNIIRLYETFTNDHFLLMVIELCGGGDLLSYVRKRQKLEEAVARVVFKQILDGLSCCHSKGIVHRDIKLDNILLNCNGDIKVDFGVKVDWGLWREQESGQRRNTP